MLSHVICTGPKYYITICSPMLYLMHFTVCFIPNIFFSLTPDFLVSYSPSNFLFCHCCLRFIFFFNFTFWFFSKVYFSVYLILCYYNFDFTSQNYFYFNDFFAKLLLSLAIFLCLHVCFQGVFEVLLSLFKILWCYNCHCSFAILLYVSFGAFIKNYFLVSVVVVCLPFTLLLFYLNLFCIFGLLRWYTVS